MVDYIKRHRKLSIFAMLIIVLAAAAKYDFSVKPGITPVPANDVTVPVETNKPTGIIRAGSVESSSGITINSQFSGRVSEIYVAQGQAVKAGQPLFKLEVVYNTGITSLSGDSYENALKEYNRLQKLYELGAIPRRQVETAAARLQTAQQSSTRGPNTPKGPITVTAPVDSIVTRLAVASGDAVENGQQVMVLGGSQAVEVVVPLEQKELNLVGLGTPATIAVAGHTIKGKVSSIFPEAQESNVPSFRAHIMIIDPPDGLLKTGISVNVQIDTGEK